MIYTPELDITINEFFKLTDYSLAVCLLFDCCFDVIEFYSIYSSLSDYKEPTFGYPVAFLVFLFIATRAEEENLLLLSVRLRWFAILLPVDTVLLMLLLFRLLF